ncbi:hypothetical protein ElyMa_006334000 [Elysia marginata]|uniref:Uncharacterized protein n=1 Tax=Elysia marginata TaxID=1093978 RepID=A0AAV4HHU6_9GAST|nr:hypothetical protein ElyMa_006334000 [Elysia marginata]
MAPSVAGFNDLGKRLIPSSTDITNILYSTTIQLQNTSKYYIPLHDIESKSQYSQAAGLIIEEDEEEEEELISSISVRAIYRQLGYSFSRFFANEDGNGNTTVAYSVFALKLSNYLKITSNDRRSPL